MTKYFGTWSSWEDMARDLSGTVYNDASGECDLAQPDADFPTDEQVVVAGYEQESYSGSSTVIFLRDGKLYEDSSSHCSCNGLEWGGGAEISWEYIDMRIADGHFSGLTDEGLEELRRRSCEELTGQSLLQEING